MFFYKRIMPIMAREMIKNLSLNNCIERAEKSINKAELDIVVIMLEYLDHIDRITKEAALSLYRRQLPSNHFFNVKKRIGYAFGVQISEDDLSFIFNKIIKALFLSESISEIYGNDANMKHIIRKVIDKYILVLGKSDQKLKMSVMGFYKGTLEWDMENSKLIAGLIKNKHFIF